MRAHSMGTQEFNLVPQNRVKNSVRALRLFGAPEWLRLRWVSEQDDKHDICNFEMSVKLKLSENVTFVCPQK